jgi:uncharacterized protein
MATPPTQDPAAPGWYPDPNVPGGQRYWDGTQWTEHQSAPAQAAAPGGVVMIDPNAKQWALFAHLSALLLGWLGPLIIYLVKKDEHPYIADQSREALNFNLSIFLYSVISGVLILVLIGIFLIFGVLIAWLVLVIIAAVKANNGEAYRYPLTIRFIS